MEWQLLAGPAALAIAASAATWALWRHHVKEDDQKDIAIRALTAAVAEFPGALKDLTGVVTDTVNRQRVRTGRDRAGDR